MKNLSLFRPARQTKQADDAGDKASNEHPNGFVSRRSSKEPGKVRTERVGGLNPHDHEHNSTDEQNNRNHSIHNNLSMTSRLNLHFLIHIIFTANFAGESPGRRSVRFEMLKEG